MSTEEDTDFVMIASDSNNVESGGLTDKNDDLLESQNRNGIPSSSILDKTVESGGLSDDKNCQEGQEQLSVKMSNINVSSGDDKAHNGSRKKNTRQKSFPQARSISKASHSGNGSHRTTSHTVSPTTDKHVVHTRSSIGTGIAKHGSRPVSSESPQHSDNLKKTQVNAHVAKPSDEEYESSVSSSNTMTVKVAKVTVPSAPVFRCGERAEKRREYYTKLEEKHQAMEAERAQNEARAKEEREAALKELRRNLIFRANPIPSFYYEGPPAKVERKKPPPTRAKSPKFSRRRSYSDASTRTSGQNGGVGDPMNRHSLGNFKDENFRPKIRAKDTSAVSKETEKPVTESPKSVPVEAPLEQRSDDITVQ